MATISNGWFVGNWANCSTALNPPAASAEGGALFNSGWAALTGVEFTGNYCLGVTGADGSIRSDTPFSGIGGGPGGGGIGGAVCNSGVLLLTNCAFAGNSVTGGNGGPGSTCLECNPEYTGPTGAPGDALGGALANFGTIYTNDITFLNNSASGPGMDVEPIYGDIPGQATPAIFVAPQSQVVAEGSAVTFGAIAFGWTNPTYQWSFNGTNLASATTTTLTLTNAQPDQTGDYQLEVLSSTGSETSAPVTLTIVAPLPITLTASTLGSAGLSISSAGIPGVSFIIEGTTDLMNWQPLQTNPSPFTFIDTNAVASPFHFYRAVEAR
jgi:hypothetical protein